MYISSPDLSSELQTPIPNFLLDVSMSKNISRAITRHEAPYSLTQNCSPLFISPNASMIFLDVLPGT